MLPPKKEETSHNAGPRQLHALVRRLSQRPRTMKEIAKELDSGRMRQSTKRELFIAVVAARDVVQYLRSNVGMSADWPLSIVTDDAEVADGLARKLTSLERLLPPNEKISHAAESECGKQEK